MSRSRVPTLRSNLPILTADELELAEQSLLLVSPTFNERSNLEELVARVFAAAPRCHLLVVDDNSPDGTAALCSELALRFPGLHLLERKGDRGLGRAYVDGLQYGLAHGYKWIGTLAPTFVYGVFEQNLLVIVAGALCGVFDLIYIGLLVWVRRHKLN